MEEDIVTQLHTIIGEKQGVINISIYKLRNIGLIFLYFF